MRRGALGGTLLLAVASALAGGCGFPAEDQPRLLSADEVGFDLLSPTTAPPTTLGPGVRTEEATLYLVDAEEEVVTPVTREIAAPMNLDTVLRALFEARPTPSEQEEGLTNVITPQTRLLEVTEDASGSRIVIDVANYFPGLTFDEVSYAIAQIVFTLSNLKGNDVAVAIFVEGQPEEVRTGDGKSVPQVTKDDLVEFDATAPTTTGTVATTTRRPGTSIPPP